MRARPRKRLGLHPAACARARPRTGRWPRHRAPRCRRGSAGDSAALRSRTATAIAWHRRPSHRRSASNATRPIGTHACHRCHHPSAVRLGHVIDGRLENRISRVDPDRAAQRPHDGLDVELVAAALDCRAMRTTKSGASWTRTLPARRACAGVPLSTRRTTASAIRTRFCGERVANAMCSPDCASLASGCKLASSYGRIRRPKRPRGKRSSLGCR
jgi:hypothetical protein